MAWALAAVVVCSACSGASIAGDDSGLEPLVGHWRGVLLTAGGELPFVLRVDGEGAEPPAVVVNGEHETPLESVVRQGAASYTLRFAGRDSEIVARMSPSGDALSGYWRYDASSTSTTRGAEAPENGASGGVVGADDAMLAPSTQMPFEASKEDRRRFARNDPALEVSPEGAVAVPEITGAWDSILETSPERRVSATLEQDGERVVGRMASSATGAGNVAAPMEGIYRNGLLRLSVFDGSRAWLLHARTDAQGVLRGSMWVADTAVVDWSGRRRATR